MSNNMPTLAIGSDHAGFDLKVELLRYLQSKGYIVYDFGAFSPERVDYPDVAKIVAHAVSAQEYGFGILICGSGQGVNIVANKAKGIRSALAWNPEIASLARAHNNANVLALPGRFIDAELGIRCLEAFLTTDFEGGRHAERLNKIEF
ncbi:MAG: ribose 5-phosphate isomerase B [Chitinophagia bacterium]|nr:ribose 5-phosphate isomerase B [Chitinophagia bacterium]